MKNRKLTFFFLALTICFFNGWQVSAATFTVNNSADTADASVGNGVCADSTGSCTLRAAVQETNALAGNHTINFNPEISLITLTQGTVISISHPGSSLTINGTGADRLTVSGNGTSNIFLITNTQVTISGMKLTGGRVAGGPGQPVQYGGAIKVFTGGSLTLDGVYVTGNSADEGGGIGFLNGGTNVIKNSTIAGNSADACGGIENNSNSSLTITNSTIANNNARAGGGLCVLSGNVTMRNVTVTANSALTGVPNNVSTGGGVLLYTGTLDIGNTIISGNIGTHPEINRAGSVFNTFTSAGDNMIGDTSGGSILTFIPLNYAGTDILNTAPNLSPLGNYGGSTPTIFPLSNSPANNAGSSTLATNAGLATDQRGVVRNFGGAVDIGAVERTSVVTNISGASVSGSLRNVIGAAAAGDIVNFEPSVFNSPRTITLSPGEITINQDLTILGTGANQLEISGNNASRIFTNFATVKISGVTLRNARATSDGGAIANYGNLTIADSVLRNNALVATAFGGAIYSDGSLKVYNSTFSNNTSSFISGAIDAKGTLEIANSTFNNNSALIVGALRITTPGTTAVIRDSTFSANLATAGNAGAIETGDAMSVTITGSTFNGNTATTYGGALYTEINATTITNSTFSGNTASDIGGGAIWIENGTPTFTNLTITGNKANTGGGINVEGGSPLLQNTIVAGNINLAGDAQSDISGTVSPSSSFNLIGTGGAGGLTNGANGNQVGVVNPKLAPLGNYGGSTMTHALLQDSPAVNLGNNALAAGLTTDQRGTNAPRITDGIVDIGAFERNITFDQSTLPGGNRSQPYSFALTATRQTGFAEIEGGYPSEYSALAPTSFALVTVAGQSLPPGLNLDANGNITGTPSTAGAFNFTVKATDADGMSGLIQYALQIAGPTAASVSISGRVMTASGRGVLGARVFLTNAAGTSVAKTTNPFGYYYFEDVPVGETYILSAEHKRYSFSSQTVTVTDEMENLNFWALPENLPGKENQEK